jgi:hypothetical protein
MRARLWEELISYKQSANTRNTMNPEAIVTLKTYGTEVAAEAAACCLEANGIRCMLTADDCGGMLSPLDNYSGVKLNVAADDAESARDILSRKGVPQLDSSEDQSPDNTVPA